MCPTFLMFHCLWTLTIVQLTQMVPSERKRTLSTNGKLSISIAVALKTLLFVRIKPSSFISMHFDSQQRVVPLEEGRYAKIDNLMDPLGGGLELLDEKKSDLA